MDMNGVLLEIGVKDFFSQWRREDFFCENPVLSEKLPFFATYWGNAFSLFAVKRGGDILGFSFVVREKKYGIQQLHSVRTPSVKKMLSGDCFMSLSQKYGNMLPCKNYLLPFAVPDYLDPRLSLLLDVHTGASWGTFCTDFLESSEVLPNISSKYLRRDIRRSLKDGSLSFVPVGATHQKGLDDFLHLMIQEKNQSFSRSAWQEVISAGEKYDAYKVFLVYQNATPVAGCCLAYGNEVAFEEGLVVAENAKEKSPYAGIFLKYNMMQWALEKGIRTYDLMGFNPHPRDPKEEAIASFKKKFSNREVIYPIYSFARGLGRVAQVLRGGREAISKKV